jgi:hypothetical protein
VLGLAVASALSEAFWAWGCGKTVVASAQVSQIGNGWLLKDWPDGAVMACHRLQAWPWIAAASLLATQPLIVAAGTGKFGPTGRGTGVTVATTAGAASLPPPAVLAPSQAPTARTAIAAAAIRPMSRMFVPAPWSQPLAASISDARVGSSRHESTIVNGNADRRPGRRD